MARKARGTAESLQQHLQGGGGKSRTEHVVREDGVLAPRSLADPGRQQRGQDAAPKRTKQHPRDSPAATAVNLRPARRALTKSREKLRQAHLEEQAKRPLRSVQTETAARLDSNGATASPRVNGNVGQQTQASQPSAGAVPTASPAHSPRARVQPSGQIASRRRDDQREPPDSAVVAHSPRAYERHRGGGDRRGSRRNERRNARADGRDRLHDGYSSDYYYEASDVEAYYSDYYDDPYGYDYYDYYDSYDGPRQRRNGRASGRKRDARSKTRDPDDAYRSGTKTMSPKTPRHVSFCDTRGNEPLEAATRNTRGNDDERHGGRRRHHRQPRNEGLLTSYETSGAHSPLPLDGLLAQVAREHSPLPPMALSFSGVDGSPATNQRLSAPLDGSPTLADNNIFLQRCRAMGLANIPAQLRGPATPGRMVVIGIGSAEYPARPSSSGTKSPAERDPGSGSGSSSDEDTLPILPSSRKRPRRREGTREGERSSPSIYVASLGPTAAAGGAMPSPATSTVAAPVPHPTIIIPPSDAEEQPESVSPVPAASAPAPASAPPPALAPTPSTATVAPSPVPSPAASTSPVQTPTVTPAPVSVAPTPEPSRPGTPADQHTPARSGAQTPAEEDHGVGAPAKREDHGSESPAPEHHDESSRPQSPAGPTPKGAAAKGAASKPSEASPAVSKFGPRAGAKPPAPALAQTPPATKGSPFGAQLKKTPAAPPATQTEHHEDVPAPVPAEAKKPNKLKIGGPFAETVVAPEPKAPARPAPGKLGQRKPPEDADAHKGVTPPAPGGDRPTPDVPGGDTLAAPGAGGGALRRKPSRAFGQEDKDGHLAAQKDPHDAFALSPEPSPRAGGTDSPAPGAAPEATQSASPKSAKPPAPSAGEKEKTEKPTNDAKPEPSKSKSNSSLAGSPSPKPVTPKKDDADAVSDISDDIGAGLSDEELSKPPAPADGVMLNPGAEKAFKLSSSSISSIASDDDKKKDGDKKDEAKPKDTGGISDDDLSLGDTHELDKPAKTPAESVSTPKTPSPRPAAHDVSDEEKDTSKPSEPAAAAEQAEIPAPAPSAAPSPAAVPAPARAEESHEPEHDEQHSAAPEPVPAAPSKAAIGHNVASRFPQGNAAAPAPGGVAGRFPAQPASAVPKRFGVPKPPAPAPAPEPAHVSEPAVHEEHAGGEEHSGDQPAAAPKPVPKKLTGSRFNLFANKEPEPAQPKDPPAPRAKADKLAAFKTKFGG